MRIAYIVISDNRLKQLLKVVKTSIFLNDNWFIDFYNPIWLPVINLTGFQVNKLTIKPGLVVEIAILIVHKSINTGHTLSNTACVDWDCDIQICESGFQRTVNKPVMYR